MDPVTVDPALAFLGIFMPAVVAFVKQSGFSKQVNSVIALAVYLLATVLYMNFRGLPLTLDSFSANAAVLTTIGLTAYKMFWDAVGPSGGDTSTQGAGGRGSLDAIITDSTSLSKFKGLRPYRKIIGAGEPFTT